jgi:transposase (fragment)
LGIDEFKGNAAGQKYRGSLTDPDSHNIVDVLPEKDTNILCRYFASYSRKARQKVRFIVMDMSPQFGSSWKPYFLRPVLCVTDTGFAGMDKLLYENIRRLMPERYIHGITARHIYDLIVC